MNRGSQRLRFALAILVLISLSLIALDSRGKGGGALGGVRHVANAVFGPIERGFGAVVHPIGQFFSDLAHAGRDGEKVRSLQKKVDDLNQQLSRDSDAVQASKELDAIASLSAKNQYRYIAGRVATLGDLSGFDQAATLNIGSRDGVRVDETVINGKGLVGRVVSVSPFTSIVALADDPNVRVGSRLQRDAHIGITSGHGIGDMTFTPTDPAVRPRPGDVVETYGSTTYVPGVPIGVVTKIGPTPGKTTITATVRHYVDFTALDVVAVVVPTQRSATVVPTLPPQPTVTVTATATVTVTPGATGSTGTTGGTSARSGTSAARPTTPPPASPPPTSPRPGG